MAVENATILIGVVLGFILLVIYRSHKFTGGLFFLATGIATLLYSSGSVDQTLYGIGGWIIVGGSIIIMIYDALSPAKKKKNY